MRTQDPPLAPAGAEQSAIAESAHSTPANPLTAGRTLFARSPASTLPRDDKARARRERLLSHREERIAVRRLALVSLLRSGALADAVAVDPQLHRDVMRLVAFVVDDA